MKSTILAFAGGIGSGKSTLSTAVAKSLCWKRASFGDYVRNETLKLGLEVTRKTLQDVGARLVDDADIFCSSFLEHASWIRGHNLVIDGIRHSIIMASLKRITKSKSNILLVFIEVGETVRVTRQINRDPNDYMNIGKYASHTTESEIRTTLPFIADLIVDGTRPVNELVREIVAWVKDKG